MATLGQTIKTFRKRKGWTQDELGEKVGLQKSAIAKYENGRVGNITTAMIEKFASAFGVSVHELLDPFESNLYALDVVISYTRTGVKLHIPDTNACAEYSSATWDTICATRDYDTVWSDLGVKEKAPDTNINVEGLSGDKKWLVGYVMSLTDEEAKQLRGVVDFVRSQRG